MPKYSSKTQSKNGGRRRKQTKRKLRRARKSRKVMRGGAGGSTGRWLDRMRETDRDNFNSLLYQYFKEKDGTLDIDAITNFSTQDEVSRAIYDKAQEMKNKGKMTQEQEDILFRSIDRFFPD